MAMTDLAPTPEATSPAGGDQRLRALEDHVRDLGRRFENNRLIRGT